MRRVVLLAAGLLLASPASAADEAGTHSLPDPETPSAIANGLAPILEHARRAGDRSRDPYRHPAETLDFFRVEPGMTVVDYMPANGWYTRVLVPYLGPDGRYIALNPAPGSNERFAAYVGGLREKWPIMASKWSLTGARVEAWNSDQLPANLNGTVDRVLIFREMHNLHRHGILHDELVHLRELLAEDGLLGIVQHRAKPDAPAAYVTGSKGYMREKDVIGLVEAHGFELVARSEINANPNDTADHEGGVWTLPPSLGGDKADHARYRTVGESDRMTLLFRKRL